PEDSLDAREADVMAIFHEQVVQDLRATPVLLPVGKNRIDQLPGKLLWVRMGTGTQGRDRVAHVMLLQIVHPPDDAALVESGVTGYLTGAPTPVDDEPGCFQAETGKVRIGGVGHVHTVRGGDAKV